MFASVFCLLPCCKRPGACALLQVPCCKRLVVSAPVVSALAQLPCWKCPIASCPVASALLQVALLQVGYHGRLSMVATGS